MFKNLNIIPRWMVFLVDVLVCYFAFMFSLFVRNDLSFGGIDLHSYGTNILVLLLIQSFVFILFKTYDEVLMEPLDPKITLVKESHFVTWYKDKYKKKL